MGMSLDELEECGNLRIHCSYPEATSPEDLLVDVREGLETFEPALIVFDSISSIEHSTSDRGFRQFLIGLSALLRQHNRSALLTQTVAAHTETDRTAPFLSTIPDAILMLDYELHDDQLQRSVRVLKMRGSQHSTGRQRLLMAQGGLQVEPQTKPTGEKTTSKQV
jgi:circadian clock protein KaiC